VFSLKKTSVGIDIGSRYIKIAEMDYSPKGAVLRNFAILPTPTEVFYAGEIQNIELLGHTLLAIMQEKKIPHKKLCLSIGGSGSVSFKKIQIASADRRVLTQTVRYEIEQYVGGDISQYVLAYSVNPQANDGGQYDVSVLMGQKHQVVKLLQLESVMKTKIEVIDYAAFALFNIWELSQLAAIPPGLQVLLHTGAMSSYLILVWEGQIDYVREISVGGHHCTLEIQKSLGLELHEAEQIKISLGGLQDVPEGLPQAVESHQIQLLEEVVNAIDYFIGSKGLDIKPQQILLSGGGSLIQGWAERLRNRFEVPVSFINLSGAFKRIGTSAPVDMAELSIYAPIALGLAMRREGDQK
jgi:type IV pilus assembly protein PilM